MATGSDGAGPSKNDMDLDVPIPSPGERDDTMPSKETPRAEQEDTVMEDAPASKDTAHEANGNQSTNGTVPAEKGDHLPKDTAHEADSGQPSTDMLPEADVDTASEEQVSPTGEMDDPSSTAQPAFMESVSDSTSSPDNNAGSSAITTMPFMRKKGVESRGPRQTSAEKERKLAREADAKKLIFEGVDEIGRVTSLKAEDNGPVGPTSFNRAQSTVYEGTPSFETPEPSSSARAAKEFETADKYYHDKQQNGGTTVLEDIQHIRLRKKEAERRMLADAARNYEARADEDEADDGLFLGLDDDDTHNYSESEDDSDDSVFGEQSKHPEQKSETKSGPAKGGNPPFKDLKPTPFSAQKISTKELNASRRAGIPAAKKRGRPKKDQSTAKSSTPAAKTPKPQKQPKQTKKTVPKKRKSDATNEDDGNDDDDEPQPNNARGRKKLQRRPEGEIKDLEGLFQTAHSRAATAKDKEAENHQYASNNKAKELAGLIEAITDDQDRDMAKADKDALMKASMRLDHHRSVLFKNGNYLVKGMKTPLRHFQLLGLVRMREFERRGKPTSGGILGDQMGLGKTMSMLANIVDGRPDPRSEVRSTLVVVPTAVLSQWMSEIRKHLDPNYLPNAVVYDRHYIDNFRDPNLSLPNHDIVLTTYHYLKDSYPIYNPPKNLDEDQKADWWAKEFDENRGPLHRIKWLRVVLDECQVIKNHTSIAAIAADALIAQHRWLLSGTVLVNGLQEMFSYSKFLKSLETENAFSSFENYYIKNDKGKARLHEYLKAIMIRRGYDDKICGKPIVVLPEMKQETLRKRLNCFEAHVYEIVRNRCRVIFTGFITENVKNNPLVDTRTIWKGVLLVVILRQLTDHFLSCSELLGKYLEQCDVDGLQRALKNHLPNTPTNVLKFINKQFLHVRKLIRERKTREDQMSTATEKSAEASENSCMVCHQLSEDLWVSECEHVLCGKCWDKVDYETLNNAQSESYCPIENCDQELSLLRAKNFREPDADFYSDSDDPEKRKKRKAKKPRRIFPLDVVMISTKMKEVKRVMRSWLEEDRHVKIVVFTQLLDVATMVHQICEDSNWTNITYTGNMTSAMRKKAVEKFQAGKAQVLIASMLAGGVGLNLTKAARALLIDLYWNEAMEQQAFSRIYRIGQEKPTSFTRLSLCNTCDDYLLQKQKIKTEDITEVLKGKGQKFTVDELLELFDISPMDPGADNDATIDNSAGAEEFGVDDPLLGQDQEEHATVEEVSDAGVEGLH